MFTTRGHIVRGLFDQHEKLLPTLDNLRNFFLTPTAEMFSFLHSRQERSHRHPHRRERFFEWFKLRARARSIPTPVL